MIQLLAGITFQFGSTPKTEKKCYVAYRVVARIYLCADEFTLRSIPTRPTPPHCTVPLPQGSFAFSYQTPDPFYLSQHNVSRESPTKRLRRWGRGMGRGATSLPFGFKARRPWRRGAARSRSARLWRRAWPAGKELSHHLACWPDHLTVSSGDVQKYRSEPLASFSRCALWHATDSLLEVVYCLLSFLAPFIFDFLCIHFF